MNRLPEHHADDLTSGGSDGPVDYMLDCFARGRRFESWLGRKIKYYEMGSERSCKYLPDII